MASYTCPTCGAKMERDLLLFKKHTDHHILEEIKKKNPAWVTDEGYCPKCLDYFTKSIRGSGHDGDAKSASLGLVNIGTREGRKRMMLGVASLGAAVAAFVWLETSGFDQKIRLALFPLLFGAMLCFLEAKKNLCVILSYKGARNMDCGEQKISDERQSRALKAEAAKVVFIALLTALALTLIFYFLPVS